MTNKNEAQHQQDLQALGQRAVDYYKDTGLCVFCNADDCSNEPHEEHCNVGELSGIEITPERIAQKAEERGVVDAWFINERKI